MEYIETVSHSLSNILSCMPLHTHTGQPTFTVVYILSTYNLHLHWFHCKELKVIVKSKLTWLQFEAMRLKMFCPYLAVF